MSPKYHPGNSFTIYSRSQDKAQLLAENYPPPIRILDLEDDVLFLRYDRENPSLDADVRAELVTIMRKHGYSLSKKDFELPKGLYQRQDVFVWDKDLQQDCEDSKMTEASATGGADKPTQENEEVAVIMSAVHVKEVEGTGASM
ncbi:hypothetical protein AnigIFM63309_003787 [Aspergillus niger]|uniref:Uncharacterized protein n=1 Tax=Aspergillus luchuensis (strain CBS 106.47) TaxID=1137211 RepID=A0A1M3SZN7_ASPLC|nr:hypothetical protein ASPFODRAFT_223754 [Aspergillus luchuensis CBS 106.47]GLA44565.1 hypothetical protein AnigIFM63309_003787 [Aspergillus niger]